jgi:hypothetical protein
MNRLLIGITASLLLGSATAQEPAKESAAPEPGAEFFAKFDLDKNGSVSWEEFQKVKSGFAALDADGNGAITAPELGKAVEQRRERMQKTMQQRMKHSRQYGRRGFGRGGPGFGPMGQGGGPGAHACPWCHRQLDRMGPGQGQGRGPRGGPRGPGRGMGWGQGAR